MREQQLQYQPWCHFRGWVWCWKSGKQTSPGENQLFAKYQMLASDMHRLHRLVLYRSCLNYMIMCQEAEIYREVIIGYWGNKKPNQKLGYLWSFLCERSTKAKGSARSSQDGLISDERFAFRSTTATLAIPSGRAKKGMGQRAKKSTASLHLASLSDLIKQVPAHTTRHDHFQSCNIPRYSYDDWFCPKIDGLRHAMAIPVNILQVVVRLKGNERNHAQKNDARWGPLFISWFINPLTRVIITIDPSCSSCKPVWLRIGGQHVR